MIGLKFSLFLINLYNWSFDDSKAQDRRTGQMLVLISDIVTAQLSQFLDNKIAESTVLLHIQSIYFYKGY